MNKEISYLNNVITGNNQELDGINNKVIENRNKFSIDTQKMENMVNLFHEGKKLLSQKLLDNDRFLKDSLTYMNYYGEIMDKIIDSRTNYLFRKRSNVNIKLENLIDNRDISTKSLENNQEWGFEECKNN